jgi:serine/threonine-protein kinase
VNREAFQRQASIFSEAAEMAAEERTAFLERACAGDDALREAVERLLAADAAAESFLRESAIEDAARDLSREETPPRRRIGHWDLKEEIGRGGMGTVYLATRADSEIRQEVAVKVIHALLGSEDGVRRFHRERQILADLEHPSIARLLDGGTTEEGLPYLVMERVLGVPIDRNCEDRELDVADRIELFLEVCEAVAHAHRKLVVHLDLKPSNILVNAEGSPKLLDFGIARLLAPAEAGEAIAPPTQTLHQALTPDFASPEQVRNRPVGTASDVYSLGVLLYLLLTGRRPYETSGLSPAEIERRVCEEDPPAPSAAVARSSGRESARGRRLAGDLDAIALKALHKEPEQRYRSADELADDLRRHLESRPVVAQRPTRLYQLSRFVRRHRFGVGAGVLLLAVLLAGIAAFAWQARRASAQAELAAAERDRAQLEATKAERINRFLQEMLAAADPGVGGRDLTVAEVLEGAAERIEGELADLPAVALEARRTLARTYVALGLLEEAEDQARAAIELLAAAEPATAIARRELGAILTQAGRFEEAEAELAGAVEALRGEPWAQEDLAIALDGLGLVLKSTGRTAEAEALYREAVAFFERVERESPPMAKSINNLAVLLGERGDFAEAEGLHRRSVAILERELGAEHPDTLFGLFGLAGVVDAQGRYAEAELLYRRLLELQEPLLGEDHPNVIFNRISLASTLTLLGRPAEAWREVESAVVRAEASLPGQHPLVAYAHLVLGRALCDGGRAAEGEGHVERALSAREEMLPPGHWLVANTRSVLGGCLAARGRFEEAERILLSSLESLRSALGETHEKTEETRARLGELYRAWGRPEPG